MSDNETPNSRPLSEGRLLDYLCSVPENTNFSDIYKKHYHVSAIGKNTYVTNWNQNKLKDKCNEHEEEHQVKRKKILKRKREVRKI